MGTEDRRIASADWQTHQDQSPFRRDGLLGRTWPFVAVALLTYGVAAATSTHRPLLVVASAALSLVLTVAAALTPWERLPRPVGMAIPLGFIAAILLLAASGPTAPAIFDSLLTVPVLAVCLYGSRRELAIISVVALGALLLGAREIIGGSGAIEVPLGGVIMFAAVGAVTARSVSRLVGEMHRRERILDRVASVSRRFADVEDPIAAACSELLAITHASSVEFVYESDVDQAQAHAALTGGEAVLAHDERHTVLYKPMDAERWRGVFAITWERPMRSVEDLLLAATRLVVTTAASALGRQCRIDALDTLSRTDALTGIANRREWDERFPREVARAARDGRLVVAMADLDHFKEFNDTRGHQAGDALLREMAAAWALRVRQTDVLARYGGEEFVLALPGCDLASAGALVEQLRSLVPGPTTCSFGLAVYDGKESAVQLVARADHALYAAKAAGRDCVRVDGIRVGVPA